MGPQTTRDSSSPPDIKGAISKTSPMVRAAGSTPGWQGGSGRGTRISQGVKRSSPHRFLPISAILPGKTVGEKIRPFLSCFLLSFHFSLPCSDDEEIHHIDIRRTGGGFGFSIRGGAEYNSPLCVLRIADGGAAEQDGRLRVCKMITKQHGAFFEFFPLSSHSPHP